MLDREHLETGNWVVAEDVAKEAVGGCVYLHERLDQPCWAWRSDHQLSDLLQNPSALSSPIFSMAISGAL